MALVQDVFSQPFLLMLSIYAAVWSRESLGTFAKPCVRSIQLRSGLCRDSAEQAQKDFDFLQSKSKSKAVRVRSEARGSTEEKKREGCQSITTTPPFLPAHILHYLCSPAVARLPTSLP